VTPIQMLPLPLLSPLCGWLSGLQEGDCCFQGGLPQPVVLPVRVHAGVSRADCCFQCGNCSRLSAAFLLLSQPQLGQTRISFLFHPDDRGLCACGNTLTLLQVCALTINPPPAKAAEAPK